MGHMPQGINTRNPTTSCRTWNSLCFTVGQVPSTCSCKNRGSDIPPGRHLACPSKLERKQSGDGLGDRGSGIDFPGLDAERVFPLVCCLGNTQQVGGGWEEGGDEP